MEILFEFLGQILVEACCQLVFTGLLDGLVTMAGVKSYRNRSQARKRGEPPPTRDPWLIAFWVLLPIALVLTTMFIVTLIRSRAG